MVSIVNMVEASSTIAAAFFQAPPPFKIFPLPLSAHIFS